MVLGIGPYVGDFANEIITFRPYARFLSDAYKSSKDVYVGTHFNRSFLYDFLPQDNIIPVYLNLTRDETNQRGYIHKSLSRKDFSVLVKNFKDEILNRCNCNKKDIDIHTLRYSTSLLQYSIYNKIFEPISIPNDIDITDYNNPIVFIPYKNENIRKMEKLYFSLKERYNNVIVIGDIKTHLSNNNIIFNYIDYFENSYKYIMKYISCAKVVICPLSHWTLICNLQNVPVFSWGSSPGQYLEDGIYHFENKKSLVFTADKYTNIDTILNMFEYFLEEKLNENKNIS